MPFLKHIVIFLYVAELVAFAMLFANARRSRRSLREDPASSLCAIMFVRILVKMVYFYVEYYILPWHLDILFNAVMDVTYILSVILALGVAADWSGNDLPLRRTLAAVAAAYVVGLAFVSLMWTDPSSNHEIVITPGLPLALAVCVEVTFLLAALAAGTVIVRRSGVNRRRWVIGLVTAAVAYALYVAAWDVSLFVTALVPLSAIKPFDGVLVYGAAIALLVGASLPAAEPEPAEPPAESRESDPKAFAAEHGLTARETEVLGLLVQGLNTTQVAERLVVSTNTARRHTYNIYQKVGVSSRYELLYLVNNPGAPIPASNSENTDE